MHWSTRFCRPLRNCSANAPCDYYITGKAPANWLGRILFLAQLQGNWNSRCSNCQSKADYSNWSTHQQDYQGRSLPPRASSMLCQEQTMSLTAFWRRLVRMRAPLIRVSSSETSSVCPWKSPKKTDLQSLAAIEHYKKASPGHPMVVRGLFAR